MKLEGSQKSKERRRVTKGFVCPAPPNGPVDRSENTWSRPSSRSPVLWGSRPTAHGAGDGLTAALLPRASPGKSMRCFNFPLGFAVDGAKQAALLGYATRGCGISLS